MRVLIGFFLLAIAFGAAATQQGSSSAQFDAANKLYYEGKFDEAAAGYRNILQTGEAAPTIYFNLGNALFKSGHLGEAMAAYRRAEKSAPRDPDIRANIQFTRNQVQGPTLRLAGWQSSLSHLTLNEWAVLFTLSFWLVFALLIIAQLKPNLRRTLQAPIIISAVVAAVLFVCTGIQHQNSRAATAFVATPEATIRTGPLEASKSLFTVHDGAELRVLEQKGDWLQVTTDEKRFGWIQRSAVATIGRVEQSQS